MNFVRDVNASFNKVRRGARRFDGVAIIALLLPIALYFWYIARDGVNVPRWDDWEIVPIASGFLHGGLTASMMSGPAQREPDAGPISVRPRFRTLGKPQFSFFDVFQRFLDCSDVFAAGMDLFPRASLHSLGSRPHYIHWIQSRATRQSALGISGCVVSRHAFFCCDAVLADNDRRRARTKAGLCHDGGRDWIVLLASGAADLGLGWLCSSFKEPNDAPYSDR